MALSMPVRPRWHALAACRGTDPAMFFPEKGVQGAEVDETRRVCASCPVQIPCREAGQREKFGIWGGSTVDERRGRVRASA